MFNLSLAAVVCGTFAWYTYATRTGLEKQYHGTTVGDMGSLQAGLVSEVQLEDYLDYDLAEDDRTLADEGKYIYWCKEHIEARTINFYLYGNGYTMATMYPVTSGAFNYLEDDFNDFTLYRNPGYLKNYSKDDPNFKAGKSSYAELNFVFRFEDVDNIGSYLPGYNVFWTGCDIEASDEIHEVYKAARIYFRNGYGGYLVNPTASEDGYDEVGGVLDLNRDYFYDYDDENREIIYGETNFYEYNADPTEESGTLGWNETDTFVANHKQGIYAVNKDTFDPKIVNYTHLERYLSKAKPITYTDETYHNLGRFDMFIYFEGWDKHVVDKEQGYGYTLDLKFEVQI